jgi:SET domain-containing protein
MKVSKKIKSRRGLRSERLTKTRVQALRERGASKLCEVRGSQIHGRGVYATQAIVEGDEIIEYVGQKITKRLSERRAHQQLEVAEQSGDAAVYIFNLDENWDIDGNFEWNPARLINHSCEPNCEAWIIGGKRIVIYALRDIEVGEELTFDYGFSVDCWQQHPCCCGALSCVGYIVANDQWDELKKLIAESTAAV